MKVYQLAAYGNLVVRRDRYRMYSHKVYRTEAQARAAILEFYKQVTKPKPENHIMAMDKVGLRIVINPLELISNKKKENKK